MSAKSEVNRVPYTFGVGRQSLAHDPILLYSFSVVKDFLNAHQLFKTLDTLNEEWRQKNEEYEPTVENWYRVSRALDFPGKSLHLDYSSATLTRCLLELKRNYSEQHPEVGDASVLEVCLGHLCEARSEHVKKKEYNGLQLQLASRPEVFQFDDDGFDQPVAHNLEIEDDIGTSEKGNQLYKKAIKHSLHQEQLDRSVEKPKMTRSTYRSANEEKQGGKYVAEGATVGDLAKRLERSLRNDAKSHKPKASSKNIHKPKDREGNGFMLRPVSARKRLLKNKSQSAKGFTRSSNSCLTVPTLHHLTYDAYRKVALRDFKVARTNVHEHVQMKKAIAAMVQKRDKRRGSSKPGKKLKVRHKIFSPSLYPITSFLYRIAPFARPHFPWKQ